MSKASLLLIASLLASISAQTCQPKSEIGPCMNGACPVAGATCLAALGTCCAAGGVVTAPTTCVDRVNSATGVSDCPKSAHLCKDAVYYDLMTKECPKTCGRCNDPTTPPANNCVDLLNPVKGVSDCPQRAYLCNDQIYYNLMTTQCPRTCGRCPATGK